MGKDKKKGFKANIFKVAGAKSLKKSKAKAVNLGLKNMKQKVADLNKEFVEIKNNPRQPLEKPKIKGPQKPIEKTVTKEEVASTAEQMIKMDL